MRFEPRFDIFALFMFLGISQAVFLAYFFLSRNNRRELSNLFFGCFLIACIVINSEILLNYSGLIVKIIRIENYSEPFIFLLMPLLFLIIKSKVNEPFTKEDFAHFFPFLIYFLYCFLYFLQSPEFKYNSYVYCYKPGWVTLPVNIRIPDDPLGLRNSLAPLYISQALIYLFLIYIKLKNFPAEKKFALFGKKDKVIKPLFGYWCHAVIITAIIIFIKIRFERDLGDYLIGSYIALLLYVSGFIVLSRQVIARQETMHGSNNKPKYEKSSLNEEKKNEILEKITSRLTDSGYLSRNTLSLTHLAKTINEAPHHVSQVINEKLNQSFFDLLSSYRIKEAKNLLSQKANNKLTIEEIAEQVGYNSKAAFNKAFKSLTGITPSEYRKKSQ